MPARQQLAQDMLADEAGAAGEQNLHVVEAPTIGVRLRSIAVGAMLHSRTIDLEWRNNDAMATASLP